MLYVTEPVKENGRFKSEDYKVSIDDSNWAETVLFANAFMKLIQEAGLDTESTPRGYFSIKVSTTSPECTEALRRFEELTSNLLHMSVEFKKVDSPYPPDSGL